MPFSKEEIQAILIQSDMAVVRGIQAIYARQTADEKSAQTTSYSNGVGFNGTDAYILSSFAKQIANWCVANPATRYRFPLSPKQLVLARRKMFKYAGQLADVANAKEESVKAESQADAAAEREAIQAADVEDGPATKSDIVRQYARERGLEVHEVRLSQIDPAELKGIVKIEEEDEYLVLS